MGRGYPASAG